MEIYLPIAGIPVDALYIIILGVVAGFLAGMFGIGGGFLITPFLIFLGINPAVAVASSANQIIASSVAGFTVHRRANNVDFKMGLCMLVGGLVGSFAGTKVTAILKSIGQADLVISLLYVFFLGAIGALMGYESFASILRRKRGYPPRVKKERHWQEHLPWKVDFPRSDMTVSIIIPVLVGFLSGIMVSLMGIGGGFLLIPAMIYIIKMPPSLVVGTSLFQMVIITAVTTFLHAYYSQTVDIVLTALLLAGSIFGNQYGTRVSFKIPAENLRGLLALLILCLAFRMALTLFITPANPFTVTRIS